MSTDSFVGSGSDAQQTLQSFWPRVMEEIRNLTVVGPVLRSCSSAPSPHSSLSLRSDNTFPLFPRRTSVCRSCLWPESRKS